MQLRGAELSTLEMYRECAVYCERPARIESFRDGIFFGGQITLSPTPPNEQSAEISSQARGVCPLHTHTSILSKFTVVIQSYVVDPLAIRNFEWTPSIPISGFRISHRRCHPAIEKSNSLADFQRCASVLKPGAASRLTEPYDRNGGRRAGAQRARAGGDGDRRD